MGGLASLTRNASFGALSLTEATIREHAVDMFSASLTFLNLAWRSFTSASIIWSSVGPTTSDIFVQFDVRILRVFNLSDDVSLSNLLITEKVQKAARYKTKSLVSLSVADYHYCLHPAARECASSTRERYVRKIDKKGGRRLFRQVHNL